MAYKHRITILGLSLLAVLALGGLTSSSVLAGGGNGTESGEGTCSKAVKETVEWQETKGTPPKTKTVTKHKAVYTGRYEDKSCSIEAPNPGPIRAKGAHPGPEGKYEWTFKPPTVTTKAATSPSQTATTLNASVNPNGSQVTECRFEYGTSASYGASVPCSPEPGAGSGPVAVSAEVSGLTPGTTYHFRAVATNAGGTVEGQDTTFGTLANSESGATVNPQEPAEAKDGPVSGTASGGTGAVSVGQYDTDPVAPPPHGNTSGFVDLVLAEGSTFATVEFTDCELNGKRQIDWWNPDAGEAGEWQRASDQTTPSGDPACITVTVNATTKPDLEQLTGTPMDPEEPEPEPVITGMSPTTGTALGGTEVSITGKYFGELESVTFGGTPAAVTLDEADLIKAISPAGPATKVKVSIKTPYGSASPAAEFGYIAVRPVVSEVIPNTGAKAGGYAVTIIGKAFEPGATTIKFGSRYATDVVCPTIEECTAIAPPEAMGANKKKVNVAARANDKKSHANPPGSTFEYE